MYLLVRHMRKRYFNLSIVVFRFEIVFVFHNSQMSLKHLSVTLVAIPFSRMAFAFPLFRSVTQARLILRLGFLANYSEI